MAAAEPPTRTPRTEPVATNPEAVSPHLDDLLERFDSVVNQLGAEPARAADRADPAVEELLELFEPDSPVVQAMLSTWESSADDGISVQPYDDQRPALVSAFDGAAEDIEVVSELEVSFPICFERRQRLVEGDVVRQETPEFFEPGRGVAVHVDGAWRLRQVDVFAERAGCRSGRP